MLLDEDPGNLISSTLGNFNIGPDKSAVGRINEQLATLREARAYRLKDQEDKLKKISRTLTTLNNQYSDTVSTHSAAAHASEVSALDTAKFRIAKEASALETETERLSSQLFDLKSRVNELDAQGPEGGDAGKKDDTNDALVLKSRVFGLFGTAERGEGGEWNKLVLGNVKKGDARVIQVDPKGDKKVWADMIWEMV